jgi:hypothetical protein
LSTKKTKSVIKDPIKWVEFEKVELSTPSESISKVEAKKIINLLIKKQESFLNDSLSLYKKAPTNELYSVITISENIVRELNKLNN